MLNHHIVPVSIKSNDTGSLSLHSLFSYTQEDGFILDPNRVEQAHLGLIVFIDTIKVMIDMKVIKIIPIHLDYFVICCPFFLNSSFFASFFIEEKST